MSNANEFSLRSFPEGLPEHLLRRHLLLRQQGILILRAEVHELRQRFSQLGVGANNWSGDGNGKV